MKEKKEIVPGATVTIRIPVDTESKYINYLNEDRDVKRNKHILNLLFTKIDEQLAQNSNKITLNLPKSLSESQIISLKSHLDSLLKVILAADVAENEQEDVKSVIEIDISPFEGMIEDD